MNALGLIVATLFIVSIVPLIFFVKSREAVIKRWLTRRSHYYERQQYVTAHHQELMTSMVEHQLTVYIDDELDESHRLAEEKYTQEGLEYLWYLEKSDELTRLTGHTMPFNNEFTQRLINAYCLVRYQLLRETPMLHRCMPVICYLCQLLQPRIDRETRVRQRALNK